MKETHYTNERLFRSTGEVAVTEELTDSELEKACILFLEHRQLRSKFTPLDKERIIAVIHDNLAIAEHPWGKDGIRYVAVFTDRETNLVWDTISQAVIHGISILTNTEDYSSSAMKLLNLEEGDK